MMTDIFRRRKMKALITKFLAFLNNLIVISTIKARVEQHEVIFRGTHFIF